MQQESSIETIENLLLAFAGGDGEALLSRVDDTIDFRIDHYRDETDVSWQCARDKTELMSVLQRLGLEVFPRGTHIETMQSHDLGEGWVLTEFRQTFYYAVRQKMVRTRNMLLSHSNAGRMDYFRETVASIDNQ
ncbi:hypothetical protein [Saccharospirillum alexandrii]|uniref:hypothetical protein n=1 Tax=Saccharospirillum alexandrii TaxID=2448477 RepID=UPI000FDB6CE9|nr:hypothetical protein [Saccharospirillum alexandrii]